MIKIKRIYDPASPEDGLRFLVDRLWPRGLNKSSVKLDGWLKDLAPSDELRKWFGHDPARWQEFQRRYFAELDKIPAARENLQAADRLGTVTLLYAARDLEHNNAIALKSYLDKAGPGEK
jgi:uncharacterized protein YeaO (DUF488 family)